MTTLTSAVTRGKVLRQEGDSVIFAPSGFSYELKLSAPAGGYAGPVNTPVEGVIRLSARKVYSVPSGGNFVTPLFGVPKIVQGRVKAVDDKQLVVAAGGLQFLVDLPTDNRAIDLHSGGISVGALVNVVAFPGAAFDYRG